MRATVSAPLLLWLLSAAAALPAFAFEQGLSDPPMKISVPRLPQVELGKAAVAADRRTWSGQDAQLAVEVQATANAAASGSTRVCAGAFLRELVRRPGMPDRDSIYRAPIDAGTFLVLYILDEPAGKRLHAHLLAAVGDTHCVDAHFSRRQRDGEDVDEWRGSFAGAGVTPAAR